MQDIPHVITDMAESWDAANKACRRSHDPNQAPNPSRRKTHIEGAAIIKAGNNKRVDKR